MASWDYPAVNGPTTANYAAPLVDFSKIDNLQKRYYEGAEMQRQQDKANVFRNGIPKVGGSTDPNAPIDIGAVTDRLARINPDYAMPLINLQMQGQMGQQAAGAITGPQGAPAQPGASPAATPPVAASQPAPRQASPQPTGAPQGDQPGSIMSMIPDGVSADDTGRIASAVANTFKLDPNAAPPAEMLPRIRAKIASLTGQPVGGAPQAASAAPAPQTVAQAQPLQANPQVPAPNDAQRLDAEATYIRARAAAMAAVNPKAAEVLNKEADARADKAKQLREQSADAPDIKTWRQSGSKLPYDEWAAQAEGSKETAKEDAKANSKKYEQFVENGVKAQQEIPQLELLQEQMNDPNFFSGAGEKYNLLYKRLKSAVGIDPDASVPQELLRKVTASNVLGSLGALKGLGPIRVAEMNMAREAAAAPDNSIPANKMLVEISKRTHQRNAEIADLAQRYKDDNGQLDAGFDKKVSQFYKERPLFSDAEIKDWHSIIGQQAKTAPGQKPTQPAKLQTFASPSAVAAAGLKKGDHFLDGNGVERMVP